MNRLLLLLLLLVGVTLSAPISSHAEDAAVADPSATADAMLLAMDKPILFYGKIVDQNGTPVTGVEVAFVVRGYHGSSALQLTTDANGAFEASNAIGNSWLITSLKKDGYEFNPANVELGRENDGSFVADRNYPVIYQLRKKEPATLVLPGEFSIAFSKRILYYEIDLVKLAGRERGYLARYESNHLHIDLKASAVYSETANSYTVKLDELDANSGITALDQMLYAPPERGYEQSYQIIIPVNSTVKKHLYVKGRSGQVYSRLDATFRATDLGVALAVKGWTNPNGGRNVDFDEDSYSAYLTSKDEQTETLGSLNRTTSP